MDCSVMARRSDGTCIRQKCGGACGGTFSSLSFVLPDSFDTRLPLNLNDADWQRDARDQPVSPRVGFTDMTISLARFETSKIGHQIQSLVGTRRLRTTSRSHRCEHACENIELETETHDPLALWHGCAQPPKRAEAQLVDTPVHLHSEKLHLLVDSAVRQTMELGVAQVHPSSGTR